MDLACSCSNLCVSFHCTWNSLVWTPEHLQIQQRDRISVGYLAAGIAFLDLIVGATYSSTRERGEKMGLIQIFLVVFSFKMVATKPNASIRMVPRRDGDMLLGRRESSFAVSIMESTFGDGAGSQRIRILLFSVQFSYQQLER